MTASALTRIRHAPMVEAIPADALTADHLAAWEAILDDAPALRSPFLAPGWTRLVAECRPGVQVGILHRDGCIAALLPFELEAHGVAGPVAPVYNDYQAVIARPDDPWTVADWMTGLGLSTWRFGMHLALQRQLAPYAQTLRPSFAIDLSDGVEGHRAWMREWRPVILKEMDRKRERLALDVGPLRFEAHVVDHDLLDHALTLKAAQWAGSGWPGRFSVPWEHRLMHRLLTCQDPSFGGLFSVLWAGETPVAMHLGMRGRRVWHGWTAVYDPAFRRYSPGMLLQADMNAAAQGLGLDEVDMGVGEYPHKRRLQTHVVPTWSGVITI